MNVKIGKFLYSNELVSSVNSIYLSAKHFMNLYQSTKTELEQKILLRHLLRFNIPYIFKDQPLIFEQIRSYIASLLDMEVSEILIIGSSKTGFTMSPDKYGKPFSDQSDIDFTLVNRRLFKQLENDFEIWRDQYLNKKLILPKSAKEENLWNENLNVVKKNLNRGFVDSWKLPNRNECCPQVCLINNAMYLITQKLHDKFNITVKHSSARIYKDFASFYNQLKLNIDYLFKTYKEL